MSLMRRLLARSALWPYKGLPHRQSNPQGHCEVTEQVLQTCEKDRGEHRCAYIPPDTLDEQCSQVCNTGSPWPGLRAPWKGKQGGHREGTQRTRLPLGTGGGTSFGSFEHPREYIAHSNKNAVIERKALPGGLQVPWGHWIKGPYRRKKEKEASLKEALSGDPTHPLSPHQSPSEMLENEAKTQGQESPAQGVGAPWPGVKR